VRWAARTALALTIAGAALFIPGITPLRLPEAPFAAFVAVVTVQTNPGATLRTSADVLRGAILAACTNLPTLALPAAVRQHPAFATLFLLALTFGIAHAKLHLITMRLALSCGTILALAPLGSDAALRPAHTLLFLALNALSVACAVVASAVPPVRSARRQLAAESARAERLVLDCYDELIEALLRAPLCRSSAPASASCAPPSSSSSLGRRLASSTDSARTLRGSAAEAAAAAAAERGGGRAVPTGRPVAGSSRTSSRLGLRATRMVVGWLSVVE